MNSHNKKALLRNLLAITGIAGVSSLLALPAMALKSIEMTSHHSNYTLAQAGGSDSSGDAYEDIQQPDDGSNGAGSLLEQNDMDSNNMDSGSENGSTDMDGGVGGGQGGVDYNNPVNPANPDSTGGEAFERAPGTQPLPDANEGSSDMMNDSMMNDNGSSNTTTEEGIGGGQGGTNSNYGSPANPANPDATGGDAFERAPSNQPLPDSNSQNNSGSGSYNNTPGSTSGSGSGSGAGGYNSSTGVRALW